MAVGFPTKANWAAGDVLTASALDDLAGTVNLLSNASATSGSQLISNAAGTSFAYQATPSASNPVLNSAMQIWQRGTSISLAASAPTTYLADRWCTTTNANQSCTVSRQLTGDTTNLPNIQYAMRFQRNSGQTGTGQISVLNNFETINTIPFVGKTITISFYGRAGANYSMASNNLYLISYTGTGTDQNALSGYTGSTLSYSTVTLTTSWQRFSYTYAVSSTTTEMAIGTSWIPTGTAGANDYYDVTGFQIDIGSVALPFRTYASTLQGELAACQRYYFRNTSDNSTEILMANGSLATTTQARGFMNFPVPMRVTPTVLDSSNIAFLKSDGSQVAITSPVIYLCSPVAGALYGTVTSSTAGTVGTVVSNTSTGYIGFGAEL
jgi:hypothetical protein